ncbi:MAG: chromosome segregation protein SMC [Desulfobacterales bacterium]
MKLKKLELNGFKSFVEKNSIEFPPGISAVVGPNGCGKSNVVDAIKWVMGEQSVKQLRGKSMEDVIFSGTNGKSPLNMAEVSLTLSNENGNAPEELKDFSEIMLTRRLYRSGESAYLINKQQCRLKDIHNIFMGTGMGTKSYSVIQQGNIGAITDSGPEERRVFIEEAAGITRYKSRKKEALGKIQATNQNLLRLTDIIAEINRQMAGLKRQAKKAERYKKHQKRIRELDIAIALHYYDDYTRKIDETNAVLTNLKDTDIEHTTRLKNLDAEVEKIKFRRSEKNQEISDQKSRIFEIQRHIDRLENDIDHFRNEVNRLINECVELESAHTNLEEKNRNLTSEVAQVETRNIDIHDNIETVRTTLHRERSAAQTIKDRLSVLNQELDICKADLMDLVAREAQYKNICQNASRNKESLKRRLKIIDEEEASTHQKVEKLRKKKITAQEKFDSYKKEIYELNEKVTRVKTHLQEKNKSLAEQVKRVQTVDLERNQAKSSYTALKKMEDNFEWYKDGVQAVMKKNRAHKPDVSPEGLEFDDNNGILGLMADIVEPKPSYETAVEAVLGESLQYILVQDQKAGLGSIDYLQTTGEGRGGFIPVSSVKDMGWGKENLDAEKRLLNHVSVKQGFEKVTQALLGHVLVTDDIEEAINIFNTNGACQTIVTKNGNLISHQGIMVGGSKEKLSGILAKKQEVKKIELEIKRLNQEYETACQDQKKLESQVWDIENDLQKLQTQMNTAGHYQVEAEKDLYKATEDLKHAQRHLEIVRLEQERLLGEESDIDEEMTKYNEAVALVEDQVKNAQETVSKKLEQIAAVSSEMEAFDQKIVDLKLQLTSLSAKLENSNNTLKRLKEFQIDGIQQLEQLSRDISQKKQKRITCKQKIEEYEQMLSGRYDEMKRLEQALEKNEEDYTAIDTKLKESDSIISDIQTRRDKTVQKIRLLELEQSERSIKRENIAKRLEESYNSPLSVFKSEFGNRENSPDISIDTMEEKLFRLRKKIAAIDDVNLGAIKEYEQLKDRLDFLNEQRDDLVKAIEDLHKVVKKINRISQERFIKTFDSVNEKLNEVFPRLFDGGSAKLIMTEPNNPLETGIEFMIHPPGKKLTRMSLLSGGEKALSAIALIFSIFLIKPSSFCLMDEIDASLDDTNVFRFNDLLRLIGDKSQIIMITHNKSTMEFADTLFGITMEKKGISKIVSVNLQKAEE